MDFVVDDFVGEGSGEEIGFLEFAGSSFGDELQIVKVFAGSGGDDLVGGDALEDAGGGGQGGDAVFDERKVEGLGSSVCGLEAAALGRRVVVVVAEGLVAQRGRAALVSGGVDVAAAIAGLGDGGAFGLVVHGGTPLG